MKEFEGRTAVVTGAASGIGLALATKFAEARMNVVMADIEQDALEKAVAELAGRQGSVTGVVTNTMRRESLEALRDRAIETYGEVHVLCNNAGIAARGEVGRGVWEIPQSDWDWVMGVNFNGVLFGLQVFVPHMLEHGEAGHIVNTASLAGLMPGGGTYGVSKHGVLVLTETLWNDLKLRGASIGASVLCPGFVATNIADAERNRPRELESGPKESNAAIAEIGRQMLARGKQPAEIADIVFESIEQERLYILPHPAWDEIVRGRVEQVLARGGMKPLIDFQEMARRQAAGEKF